MLGLAAEATRSDCLVVPQGDTTRWFSPRLGLVLEERELAERFGLDEVRVVDVPFDRLVTGDTCAVPEHITAVVVGRTGADGI